MIHWGVFGGSVSRCCLTLLTVRFGPSEAKSNIWITEQHVQFQHTNRSALSRFFFFSNNVYYVFLCTWHF